MSEQQKTSSKFDRIKEVPHLLLLYVAQRPETLRWAGNMEFDGQKLRAVTFTTENGAQMNFYFDAQTNLLVRTEQIGSLPQLGDVTTGNIYSDYQQLGNIKLPRKRLRSCLKTHKGCNRRSIKRIITI